MAIYYNGHLQATKGGGGSSGGGGIDYSITEQNTGLKWVDGKPIYQCTIVMGNSVDLSPNGTIIPTGMFTNMNIDNIIDTIAYRRTEDNRDGVANIPVSLWKNSNVYTMYSIGTWAGVHTFTIKYTKTTDQVTDSPIVYGVV